MARLEQEVAQQSTARLITDNLDIWTGAIAHKSGTGRGASKKYSLHGIQKLRELILELAVRGRLVPQDETDEPASVLLERIAEKKAQLIKEGKIKKAKALPAISEDEKPFELPNGWGWSHFINLLDFSGGGQPPKNYFSEEMKEGYVQLIQIRDLGPNPQPVFIPKEKASKFCTSKDVMVGRYGASVGKVFWGKDGAYNVALVKIHNEYECFTPEFIHLLLRSPLGQSLFSGISRSAQDGFSKNDIAYKLLPVLSQKEQQRIVAKVDELMRLCDALEAQTIGSISAHQTLVETLLDALLIDNQRGDSFAENWQRVLDHFDTLFTTTASIDTLKQTILQLAVMGKLVPQDANDEPASKLLERIAEEKAQLIKDKKIKKQKPLPAITEDEKLFELPVGWEWCQLGELVTIRGGKRLPKGNVLSTDITPYIYIRVSDMKDGSIKDDDLHYISQDVQGKISNYIITSDDIYMTIVGATIGKCGLVPPRFSGMNLTENAARLTPFLGIDKDYLFKYLDCEIAQDQFLDKTKQVGVQKMALNRLSSTIVPLPPIQEQHRIVTKVDELLSLCDQLKARLQQAQEKQVLLTDAIVTQAL